MIANQLIIDHEAFIDGMRADSVEEKDGVLVFKGNYFLDEKDCLLRKPQPYSICLNS